MPELKPCPFCGGKPYARVNVIDNTLQFYMSCEKCGVRKEYNLPIIDLDFDSALNNVMEEMKKVISEWNRRQSNATD